MASQKVTTLAIDIGGSGIKTMLIDSTGRPISDRLRSDTPVPATPTAILSTISGFAAQLGKFDRISAGFPGVVKQGITWTAHNLDAAWINFHFQEALEKRLKAPARVANDAAVQGYGAIKGVGVELVITLGTGLGSSLFTEGHLVPGLELAHHPWHKNKTYEEYLGKKALHRLGVKHWNKEVQKAIEQIRLLFNFDHLYIGGGNAGKIDFTLPSDASIVPNQDGLIGGVALWRDANAASARPKKTTTKAKAKAKAKTTGRRKASA